MRREGRTGAVVTLLAGALLLLVGACARQGAPRGGPEDRRPPQVLSVEPDTFALVEPGQGRIRIAYNERISERPQSGTLDDAVTVSPRTGEVRVSHSRAGLNVELLGGFRPGTVYRVTVEPVIVDMFNNPMAVPFEWAFSTGPDFEENAVVGLAFDRVTGEPVAGARVQAVGVDSLGRLDSIPQVSRMDDQGLFAFRYLPAGEYRVIGFLDRDRDGEPGPNDTRGSAPVTVGRGGVTDTTYAFVPLLSPDTTPAVLARAEFIDSLALRVDFDDYLDPVVPLTDLVASLDVDQELVDSIVAGTGDTLLVARVRAARTAMPRVSRIVLPKVWQAEVDSLQRITDSLAIAEVAIAAADSTAGDPLPAQPGLDAPAFGGLGAEEGGEDEEDRDLLPDGTPRPVQQVVVVFMSPVPAEVPLRFTVDGAVNVNGLQGGGGSIGLRRELPPPPDTAAADSLGAPELSPDTIGVDTFEVDTFAVAPVALARRLPTALARPLLDPLFREARRARAGGRPGPSAIVRR